MKSFLIVWGIYTANQDILYELWTENKKPRKNITLRRIGEFAKKNKKHLNSGGNQITYSGLYYAVLKFILEYCSPADWPNDLWEKFRRSTDNQNGKYSIWKSYPNLKVNITGQKKVKQQQSSPESVESARIQENTVSKKEFLDSEMYEFAEFIVDRIEKESILGNSGWLEQLKSYHWPPGKGNFEEGIEVRKHFNYILNSAVKSTGRRSNTFKYGICNAIAGWGGLKEVSREDCSSIFRSIKYLKRIDDKEKIDLDEIFDRRIALSSKMYYFSDPLSWTIYDSRVALTLSQLAYLFRKENKDNFNRIRKKIIFPIPPTRSKKRKHLFEVKWKEDEASLWFIRASLLLRAIAKRLNERNYPSPPATISSSHSWELYHVEMIFFRLGKENWHYIL